NFLLSTGQGLGVARRSLFAAKLETASFATAALALGVPRSPQIQHYNFYDRQSAVPRPGSAYVPPAGEGVTLVLGSPSRTEVPGYAYAPANAFLNVRTAARADVVIDTTKLTMTDGFMPSAIPAKREPFFGSGEHAYVLAPPGINHLVTDTRISTDLAPIR